MLTERIQPTTSGRAPAFAFAPASASCTSDLTRPLAWMRWWLCAPAYA